jgi:hypothetical protein
MRCFAYSLVVATLAACSKPPVEVWLWSNSSGFHPASDRNASIQDVPCGAIERHYMTSFPQDKSVEGSDAIEELFTDGRSPRMWRVPAEAYITDASDSSITVNSYDHSFVISASGAIREIEPLVPRGAWVKCPRPNPAVPDEVCWQVPTQPSPKVFAFVLPCT